jgi:hypothetical protein
LHSIGVKCSMDRWTWKKKSPWGVRVFFYTNSPFKNVALVKIMGRFPSKGFIASLFNHPFPAASTPFVPSISIPAWPLYAWHILEVNSYCNWSDRQIFMSFSTFMFSCQKGSVSYPLLI